MYRQYALLKLNVSIYRYHIAAGAATYFIAPAFSNFLQQKRLMDKVFQERREMEQKGLLNH